MARIGSDGSRTFGTYRGDQPTAQANVPGTLNNGNPGGANNTAWTGTEKPMPRPARPEMPSWMRRNGQVDYMSQNPNLGRYRAPQLDSMGNQVGGDMGGYAYNLPNSYGSAITGDRGGYYNDYQPFMSQMNPMRQNYIDMLRREMSGGMDQHQGPRDHEITMYAGGSPGFYDRPAQPDRRNAGGIGQNSAQNSIMDSFSRLLASMGNSNPSTQLPRGGGWMGNGGLGQFAAQPDPRLTQGMKPMPNVKPDFLMPPPAAIPGKDGYSLQPLDPLYT